MHILNLSFDMCILVTPSHTHHVQKLFGTLCISSLSPRLALLHHCKHFLLSACVC